MSGKRKHLTPLFKTGEPVYYKRQRARIDQYNEDTNTYTIIRNDGSTYENNIVPSMLILRDNNNNQEVNTTSSIKPPTTTSSTTSNSTELIKELKNTL